LSESKHFSPVNGAVAGDHTVTGNDVLIHVEIATSVLDQGIDLLEAAVVKQQFKALTCRHFASVVLGFNTGLTSTGFAAGLPIS
jgi:hypothetical protein